MKHLGTLFHLKFVIFKNSILKLFRRSKLEFLILFLFIAGGGTGLFYFFQKSFNFFQQQKPFGPILLDETFYLFNFTLFIMLLISSGVSAFATLFKSKEVPFLLTRGVEWPEIFFVKTLEALWLSSWSFMFITIPFMTAYAVVKGLPVSPIPFLCVVYYLPFVLLATLMGTTLAILAIWLLPTRRRRQVALLIFTGILILLFMQFQPQIVREQGSISGVLSGYLPQITYAKHSLLPSTWASRGILAFHHMMLKTPVTGNPSLFYGLVLFSNTLFILLPAYVLSRRLYPYTYLRSMDLGQSKSWRRFSRQMEIRWFDRFTWPSRPAIAFLEKDLKTFYRDASEWSQLIIFFGLLLVYFLNLKNLQFHVLKDFWKNLVFVLNTIGTYIVLSSFSMRLIFPMLSLEGSRAWLLGLAPIRFSSLLLEKFVLGMVLSTLLTLPLTFLSGWMLDIAVSRLFFTTGLGFFVCVALTGLSVGLGAKFPNFKSNNPSEIISGIGGSLLLILHLCYLAAVALFLMLSQNLGGIVFMTVAAASLLIGMIPIFIGMRTLERMEF